MKTIVFIDSEITVKDNKIKDLGAIKDNGDSFHDSNIKEFGKFIGKPDFVCGHNIIDYDYKFLKDYINSLFHHPLLIDTLPISPLLFPKKPYHNLLKDDKIYTEEVNNPLNDAIKCRELFDSEVSAFNTLNDNLKRIYYGLLSDNPYFKNFFVYIGYKDNTNLVSLVKEIFKDNICDNADITNLIKEYPVELAYCLAVISTKDKESIIPHWVHMNYPMVDKVMDILRETPCKEGCNYCSIKFDSRKRLKEFFGYDNFRTFDGVALQENAVNAAINKESILTIFPTGGGKSITFQLPALIAGETSRALTIVISPLQSLMKDQVDNLNAKGIVDAVTINGMLSPVERQESIERVMNGMASILYISPETLRSKTLERILLCRKIERIAIDEAHCFSSWGQDFRVDYLYIAEFVKNLEKIKKLENRIPISCFTATAKPKVISDIKDYFSNNLGIELRLFATSSSRKNLSYHVIKTETDDDKYQRLRDLIIQKNCPTIVYTSRVGRTASLAKKLVSDGFSALPFNGRMDSKDKQLNQESFMKNETQIMVATSAFGMGVDKDDVKLVVHYDISDSLENYVQEAGRAGRNQNLEADCYVLYNERDLDDHFSLLSQSKLSVSDIKEIWKAIKDLTKTRPIINCTALEIARQAGWDDSIFDIEGRVRTAVCALENAGFVKRGQNSPRVFATSIRVKNYIEAEKIIDSHSGVFDDDEIIFAKRIIKALIGAKSRSSAGTEDAESRVEYLADSLGIDKFIVISCIDKMKELDILKNEDDMHAYIRSSETQNKAETVLSKFTKLEEYMLNKLIVNEPIKFDIKEFIDQAVRDGIGAKNATEKNIKTIIYIWKLREFIKKESSTSTRHYVIEPLQKKEFIRKHLEKRNAISFEIINILFNKTPEKRTSDEALVGFSMKELLDGFNNSLLALFKAKNKDIQESLLYLNKINALSLEGGFMVLYNAMQIQKVVDNKVRYTAEDYKQLGEFYNLKIQQIHVVGEYANMMCRDIKEAQTFVFDYFNMDYDLFIRKYFKNRASEIKRNITANKYNKIFGNLSPIQRNIIDDESQYITVIAGPGSGKTMVLVHKLASLLLLEDVKSEQLLMLTFSRAAANEFKLRLQALIGDAANYVEIKTFHSYCFDLLGKMGNEEEFDEVVPSAIDMIRNNEVEVGKITKTCLVIDEAQDMDEIEYTLIKELINYNDDMRVIAVGDDDQNIYEFRGSSSKHMQELLTQYNARKYEMVDNYRSVNKIVALSNSIASKIKERIKESPIVSMRKDDGSVCITKYESPNMEYGILKSIQKNQDKLGQIAVLTKTNDEALKVTGLLIKNGIDARLIQDDSDFKLYNLVEVRYLISLFEKDDESPIITDEEWINAIEVINYKYANSKMKEILLNILGSFAKLYKCKYKSDLVEFVRESDYDDFVDVKKCKVVVSTIHKSKGKEFDTVYLFLNKYALSYDEKTRDLYVGITRAKTNLFIHYCGRLFNGYQYKNYVTFDYDNNEYETPNEMTIELSHRDVFLGYFEYKKVMSKMESVCTGDNLNCINYGLTTKDDNFVIAKFSKDFEEKLYHLSEIGYKPDYAFVRFVIYWKDNEDLNAKEVKMILPTIHLVKTYSPVIEDDDILDYSLDYIDNLVGSNKQFKEIGNQVVLSPVEKENKVEEKVPSKPATPEQKLEKDGFNLVYKDGECVTDLGLLAKVRFIRMVIAREENRPAYTIVSNQAVVSLATYKPKNKDEFIKLKGLGPITYEKWGERFIFVIDEYLKNTD